MIRLFWVFFLIVNTAFSQGNDSTLIINMYDSTIMKCMHYEDGEEYDLECEWSNVSDDYFLNNGKLNLLLHFNTVPQDECECTEYFLCLSIDSFDKHKYDINEFNNYFEIYFPEHNLSLDNLQKKGFIEVVKKKRKKILLQFDFEFFDKEVNVCYKYKYTQWFYKKKQKNSQTYNYYESLED